MNKHASGTDIVAYLSRMKQLMSDGKYTFVRRRKNMQAIAEHGISIEDVKNEIMGLVVDDYYKGPKKDYDPNRPGDIWEFKKSVDDTIFYVKVKITCESGEEVLKCLSFHEDEFQ